MRKEEVLSFADFSHRKGKVWKVPPHRAPSNPTLVACDVLSPSICNESFKVELWTSERKVQCNITQFRGYFEFIMPHPKGSWGCEYGSFLCNQQHIVNFELTEIINAFLPVSLTYDYEICGDSYKTFFSSLLSLIRNILSIGPSLTHSLTDWLKYT